MNERKRLSKSQVGNPVSLLASRTQHKIVVVEEVTASRLVCLVVEEELEDHFVVSVEGTELTPR